MDDTWYEVRRSFVTPVIVTKQTLHTLEIQDIHHRCSPWRVSRVSDGTSYYHTWEDALGAIRDSTAQQLDQARRECAKLTYRLSWLDSMSNTPVKDATIIP